MLLWPLHPHTRTEFKAVFPSPTLAKGTLKVSGKRGVATAIFERGQGESEGLILQRANDMKQILKQLALVSLALLRNAQGQGFVNLDFESANVSGYSPGYVPISATLPSWTAYYGPSGNPTQSGALATIAYNSLSLGGALVVLVDTNMGSPYTAIQGTYSLLLEGSTPFAATSASIGQTGTIPLTAQSLTFIGRIGSLQISFNGQPLTYLITGSTANYNIYGADVSAFAGQTGQLLFTSPVTSALLDNIQFSSTSVPEPSIISLFAVSAVFFGFRRSN